MAVLFEIYRPLEDDHVRNLSDHLSSELLDGPKLQVTRRVTTQSEEDRQYLGEQLSALRSSHRE
jgi:hypothetical protein